MVRFMHIILVLLLAFSLSSTALASEDGTNGLIVEETHKSKADGDVSAQAISSYIYVKEVFTAKSGSGNTYRTFSPYETIYFTTRYYNRYSGYVTICHLINNAVGQILYSDCPTYYNNSYTSNRAWYSLGLSSGTYTYNVLLFGLYGIAMDPSSYVFVVE